MAEAKNDQKIILKVPAAYRENYPRYLQVIRNIAWNETPVAQRVRMQKLEERLNVPGTSEVSALRLEAIGQPALSILKRGLQNKDIEVRFNSAMALTYLEDPEGLETLAAAIREEPAFRVYACAAMASSHEAEASIQLRELLGEASTETRYGSFRALTVLNEKDPAIAGRTMTGSYKLHVLDTAGPPLVHLTHHTKAEIVLFGADQKLQLPAVLRAGNRILLSAPPGSELVSVSCYGTGKNEKRTVEPTLAKILIACDELGATYPDVAAMLAQADKQHNLPGGIAIDALPTSGRVYYKEKVDGKGQGKGRTIGADYLAPNIFAPPDDEAAESQTAALKARGDLIDEPKDEKKDVTKSDVRRIGDAEDRAAEADENAILPASAEKVADGKSDDGKPAATDEPADEVFPDSGGNSGSTDSGKKWYDPTTYFNKPGFLSGGPPPQSEPEPE